MKLSKLISDFVAAQADGWLVLEDPLIQDCGVRATRYYAAYGNIRSLSLSPDPAIPGAPPVGTTELPAYPDPEPAVVESRPITDMGLITPSTEVSTGEWAIIQPLFMLYLERANAIRLEASRAAGVEVYGRTVSEIVPDIERMENETIPNKSASHAIITVA